jgi:hypothetical protein
MYIKTIVAPRDIMGYILLGKSSNLLISDTIDYITVVKKLSHEILVDSIKNNIYLRYSVMDRIEDNKLVDKVLFMYGNKNPVHYSMIDVATTDTCFFEEYENNYHVSKESYISIVIGEYFSEVKVRNTGDSIYTKLKENK